MGLYRRSHHCPCELNTFPIKCILIGTNTCAESSAKSNGFHMNEQVNLMGVGCFQNVNLFKLFLPQVELSLIIIFQSWNIKGSVCTRWEAVYSSDEEGEAGGAETQAVGAEKNS